MKNFENEILVFSEKMKKLKLEIWKKIIWQKELVELILIWVFSEGHILLEWMPWLAKTLTISTLSKTLDLGFNRVQFTPDLLPSDLIWTEVFNQKTTNFETRKWPIFNNFILADEINRAPSKVQSALLEAMAEKTITIWKETFFLEQPFMVFATQNPVEQSGTYKLPEAQLDRFSMKIKVDYPTFDEEKEMYKRKMTEENNFEIEKILTKEEILGFQKLVKKVFVSDSIFDYVSRIIDATRFPEKYWLSNLKKYLNFWSSPRWGLSLISSAKVFAALNWRSFVIPEDIKYICKNVLNHRISLSYEAIADEISEEKILEEIISKIKIS